MSFPLPEFQYSMPVVARPRYKNYLCIFHVLALPNSLSLPRAYRICLDTAYVISVARISIFYAVVAGPRYKNYLCIFHVLALPNSLSLPRAYRICLDTAYVISVARISIFYARGR